MNNTALLAQEARRLGAVDVEIEWGAKHPKLRFTFRGRPLLQVLTGTGYDGPLLALELAQLHRLMGVRPGRRKSDRPRRRRHTTPEAEPAVPVLTILPDPFEPLADVRERVELDCRCRRPGIEGVEARVERRGVQACERIRAYAAEILAGMRS